MFESMEFRKVVNGFIVTVVDDAGTVEYVFDTQRKVLKFIKEQLEGKSTS
jgi:hypothetical protein